jgi:DNA polymerase I-like protein with 3'-5' exonuclease and polymerase domains
MNIALAQSQWFRASVGLPEAPILVLCDPQTQDALIKRRPMGVKSFNFLADYLARADLPQGLFQFVALCPPIPEAAVKSAKRTWDFVQPFIADLDELIARRNPRMIVPIGNLAVRAVTGSASAITKCRGIAQRKGDRIIFPILSPGFIQKVPEQEPVFRTDFITMKKIVDNDFDEQAVRGNSANYEWCWDLQELIDNKPKFLAVDTEGTGLRWYRDTTKIICVQLTPRVGHTLICPIHPEYRRRWFDDQTGFRGTLRLRKQLQQLMADPDIAKVAHNLKFDSHVLREEGMPVTNWVHDTMQLAFAVDENMTQKNLDDCVKRWVPEMAGYADVFNQLIDKNDMMSVPPEDVYDDNGVLIQPGMRNYAGGDPDATFRLAQVLVPLLRQDPMQYNCYRRIMMPGLLAFGRTIEVYGQNIDLDYLRQLEREIKEWVAKEYTRLIAMVPPAVRRKTIEQAQREGKSIEKMLSFTRDDFMRDILFSDIGFKLKPKVFTDGTAHFVKMAQEAKSEAERQSYLSQLIPSVSSKTHMPYFEDARGTAGEFVRGYIQYQKAVKLLSTYIGEEEKGSGFWKYMVLPERSEGSNMPAYGHVHPSYRLDKTNTGRTSSQEPNGQNIPKRGEFAKTYRKSFKATPGYRRVDCDLSQIELRLVAWMANEREMLRVYAEGGDIHTETAQATLKISIDDWMLLDGGTKKDNRTKAKAVNFGFVYGMGWRGFKGYAKTQYGVEYTDREAEETRTLYFRKYPGLVPWHKRMKEWAHKTGFVRSLHGALRRLPSIWSNDESAVAMAERQAVNAPIQRFGSDLGVIAATMLERHADPRIVRPVGFIHDCLACEALEGYEDEAAAAIKWIMQNIPLERYFGITPPIPIVSDPEVEDADGKMQERPDIVAKIPWFWRDEVEELFETQMAATGCNAFVPYVPFGDSIPALNIH